MKLYIVVVICLAISACQIKNGLEIKDNDEVLSSEIDFIIKSHDFNGVVLLIKNASIIYKNAVGYSNIEQKIAINLDDQFVIGSISKQITAVLILKEYEKGTIILEDAIKKYMPKLNQPWADKVTVHHLLTHTHGITDVDQPLEFEQGTAFHYSQLGYELLAQILESVSGKSFEMLSTEMFAKYGLSNTYHPENKHYQNLVKGYEESETGKLEIAANCLENYAAAGSFISNVEDLNKWNVLLYSGKIVKKTTLELMRKRYATRIHPIFEKIEYGYGLLFKDGENDIQIGAFGYAPGFVSACYHYPKKNMNLIVLQNKAMNLNDFKVTFQVPVKLMELVKK